MTALDLRPGDRIQVLPEGAEIIELSGPRFSAVRFIERFPEREASIVEATSAFYGTPCLEMFSDELMDSLIRQYGVETVTKKEVGR